jgi:ADP-dependent NAD(P)H-hydrate dehydratase / NAD(P)H-hydrate epimerase
MQPIYTTADIRQIESAALANGATDLMDRAGLAAAELARKLLPDGAAKILVLAGPGNNGGDALVVARHLLRWWFNVEVVFFGEEKKLPSDAAQAHKKFLAVGGKFLATLPEEIDHDLIIDGIFGLGLSRDTPSYYIKLFNLINDLNIIVLSLDIPSGIDADTGVIRGAALRATHTISFIAHKPGLLTLDGPDYAGQLHLADLQLEAKKLCPPQGYLLDQKTISGFLKPRPRNSHKGTFGSVGIIGGAQGMAGAALLVARASLKLGAGKVFVSMLAENIAQMDIFQPELMWRAPEDLLLSKEVTALAIGCGMGDSDFARILLRRAIALSLPLLIDADALNILGADDSLLQAVNSRAASTILTPHPAEAARLLKISTKEIQQNRVAAANELAKKFNAFVVLKGNGSICATPNGHWFINPTGNSGMASAGMGDVLSGIIVALLAQGLDAEQALLLGVYLHGAAADACVENGIGPVGLIATEVTDSARNLLNSWIQ